MRPLAVSTSANCSNSDLQRARHRFRHLGDHVHVVEAAQADVQAAQFRFRDTLPVDESASNAPEAVVDAPALNESHDSKAATPQQDVGQPVGEPVEQTDSTESSRRNRKSLVGRWIGQLRRECVGFWVNVERTMPERVGTRHRRSVLSDLIFDCVSGERVDVDDVDVDRASKLTAASGSVFVSARTSVARSLPAVQSLDHFKRNRSYMRTTTTKNHE